ncbi:twin-arginine translocation signal domain-containing protein [Azorhizobium caulinodans]
MPMTYSRRDALVGAAAAVTAAATL